VAAYGFEEGAGSTVADSSGNGNTGTTTNTSWSSAGKYGKALSFNGSSSWVTIADANSLDLTSGETLEAWVNPTVVATGWRTVLFKQQTGGMVYTLYAAQGTGKPLAQVNIGGEKNAAGPNSLPINSWSFLAATYDGTTLRLYLNASQIASLTVGGPIPASTGVLRIGGNSIWNEWYAGLIDNIRVYNRPLTTSELQTDMNTAVR
jgi:hypothetical protein